ncbi:hypothetical protein V6N13_114974 [Hibiscus sabdariffa]|uniref:Uncharacterized protein n=1 Tax=Hibiscus sabdariffa TaxID=183260 RepID=A0ABR2U3E0_9ROSI
MFILPFEGLLSKTKDGWRLEDYVLPVEQVCGNMDRWTRMCLVLGVILLLAHETEREAIFIRGKRHHVGPCSRPSIRMVALGTTRVHDLSCK